MVYAYRKITAYDLAKGVADLPKPAQRVEDFSNTENLIADFLFIDRYLASTVLKVVDFKKGEPVFEFASLVDVSGQTAKKTVSDEEVAASAAYKTESGIKYAGYAAGIPDLSTAWTRGLSYENVLAQWGPEPADKNMKGKIDAEGNRKRMADWQYLYRTDLSKVSELKNYRPSEGNKLAVGDYVLFGTYSQGIGEVMSGGASVTEYNRSYASDLYNMEGTNAIIKFWKDNILDDEVLALLKENAAQNPSNAIFEDSYEYHKTGPIWTTNMLQAISADHNYNAAKYAPVYALLSTDMMGMPLESEGQGGEGAPADAAQAMPAMPGMTRTAAANPSFKDDPQKDRIVEDMTLTFGRLFRAAHIKGIGEFAASFGYVYRAQIQASSTGVAGAEINAGIQETDNNGDDGSRNLLGAANMNGSNIISSESITWDAKDYNVTWKPLLIELNRLFGSGISRHIYHGVPFVRTFNGYGNAWPGWVFGLGSTGFGAFDSRQAYFNEFSQFNNYVSRNQAVLQTGNAKVDLAIMEGSDKALQMSRQGSKLPGLLNLGYNYNIIDETMIGMPNATVSGGMLAADGPAYKGLVILGAKKMSVSGMDKIISLAKAGLPIFIYKSDIKEVYGTNTDQNNDDLVKERFETLKSLKNVFAVANESELISKIIAVQNK